MDAASLRGGVLFGGGPGGGPGGVVADETDRNAR